MNADPSHALPLPSLGGDADVAFDSGQISLSQASRATPADLEQLFDLPVTVSALLGHIRMPVGELLKIGPGTLLELDRRVGEPVDILVNDRLVARGEVVLVDERLGVTMTEIVLEADTR